MIPLTLQLKNFLSYGEEPVEIDFSGMHTICLSGENGHGKSALLDAITWSLWGETRLGKRDHELLIRRGADEMWVNFTFEADGQVYRTRRQRSKRSAGHIWELQQQDGAGNWRSRTGTGPADTERAIRDLLRMSYDTFVNSAYLRQGRADEFVRQTSNKRKEILCEILDLSRYDELEVKARSKMRESSDNAIDAERRVNLATAILAEEPSLRSQLETCLTQIASATSDQEKLNTQWDEAREQHHALKAKQIRRRQIDTELAGADAEIKRAQSELAIEELQHRNLTQLISQRETIVAEYNSLIAARAECQRLEAEVTRVNILERERLSAQHEVDSRQKALAAEVEIAQREQSGVADRIATLDRLKSEMDRQAACLTELQPRVARRVTLHEKDIPEARDRFSDLKHERALIDEKIGRVRQRLDNLANQRETCSVCGSPLPPSKIAGLTLECQNEFTQIESQKSINVTHLQECKLQLDSYKALSQTLDNDHAEHERLSVEINSAKRAIEELPELNGRAAGIAGRLSDLRKQLEGGAYAPDARKRLDDANSQLETLAGVDKLLEEARSQVHRLDYAQTRVADLAHADEALEGVDRRIAGITQRISQLDTTRANLVAQSADLSNINAEIKVLEESAESLRTRRQELTAALQHALQERGRLEENLARCEKARLDKAAFEMEQQQARSLEESYKQLAAAFGKQGVQALIIENAVPEMENDANDILERLTDGDMRVQIETQKLAKAKGAPAIETLEVLISDNLGTRPLELYSGGESFRVSFALRIALSKLLARRAGARLQTLIIDEGFGTQDGKGREKLVDAIHAIKDDFERIIVITHVDELKEAFPSRIDVYKTPAGSQVNITEGGIIG